MKDILMICCNGSCLIKEVQGVVKTLNILGIPYESKVKGTIIINNEINAKFILQGSAIYGCEFDTISDCGNCDINQEYAEFLKTRLKIPIIGGI